MRIDQLTYKRATGVSVRGLIIQVVFAVAFVIYGFRAGDASALNAAIYLGAGILAWLALAIVFDQHRRERLEAFEQQALAESGAADTSVFGSGDDEFRPAQRRLNTLYRWFVPIVALLMAGTLIGLGVVRFLQAREDLPLPGTSATRLPNEALRGWALAIATTVAFAGFVFARYASGMGKQKVWASLKAGAAVSAGSSLLGLLLAIAHFIKYIGPDVGLVYLPIITASLLVLLGAEIVVRFLLELYRPRKAGEFPAPAFESKLLGLFAAPDRIAESISGAINYQFGSNVSDTWFYRLVLRSKELLLLVAILLFWGMTSIVVVEPHQRGLILRGGAVAREAEPGLHFKYPWPFERLEVPVYGRVNDRGRFEEKTRTVTGLRVINLATASPSGDKPILWTNEHARDEVFQLVQPARATLSESFAAPGAEEPAMTAAGSPAAGARDLAMISLEVPVHYVVRDVKAFESLGPPAMRDPILRGAGQRELIQFLGTYSIDQILGKERAGLAEKLRARVQAAYDRLNVGGEGRGAGVEVVFVGLNGAHPPRETAASFERVVQAEQNRQSKVETARAEAIERLTRSVGSVDRARTIASELMELEKLRETGAKAELIAEKEFAIQRLLEQAGGEAAAILA
ncbi:MAG: SPFH domain-containing protein [Planctomycetota bacterium]|nr:SPFH domain-containing protein [Planctomycetota bacterium]